MLRLGFFKTVKPRKFNPIPRFYNPQKEALEQMLIKQDDSEEAQIERIKHRVRNKFQAGDIKQGMYGSAYTKAVRKSNLRLLVILIVISLMVYLIVIY